MLQPPQTSSPGNKHNRRDSCVFEPWRTGSRHNLCARADAGNPKHPHGPGNILHFNFAQIFELEIKPVPHLIARAARNADAAALGESFKTGGHIHAVAQQVFPVRDDIADIDTDPQDELAVFGDIGVADGNICLDIDGAAQRIDGAGEFNQKLSPAVLAMRP